MRFAPVVLGLSLLTLLGIAPGGPARAQIRNDAPIIQEPDIQQVSGYTVRIVRMERNSYGYEIRRGSKVLVHQRRNPFTGSLQGLQSRADAQKTALWVLQNVVMTDRMRPRDRRLPDGSSSIRFIPSTVAAELGVTLDTTR